MKKTILTGLFCAFATTAFAGGNDTCVSYEFHNDGGGYISNNCPYTVFIRAHFNNGYEGGWGPLAPGQGKDTYPGRDADRVTWKFCDWDERPGCTAR